MFAVILDFSFLSGIKCRRILVAAAIVWNPFFFFLPFPLMNISYLISSEKGILPVTPYQGLEV